MEAAFWSKEQLSRTNKKQKMSGGDLRRHSSAKNGKNCFAIFTVLSHLHRTKCGANG